MMISSFIQSIGFLLDGAETVFESGTSFYATITSLLVIAAYVTHIGRRAEIFTSIEKFDAFIERCKCD